MDFIRSLGISYPNVAAVCFGDPTVYANIQWEGEGPFPTEEEMKAEFLLRLKETKVAELSLACQDEIIGGFQSSALGEPAIYDSEQVDQLNLIGAATATGPITGMPDGFQGPYAVRQIVNGVVQPKQYLMHSYSQLREVLLDGFNFKLVRLQKFNNKRDYVNNVSVTVSDVNAVTWNSVEAVVP